MKFAAKSLMFLIALAATFAYAQTIPAGTFKHIIIVVQENRTPDNLFGTAPSVAKCGTEDPFEAGVDIENGGYGYVPQPTGPPVLELICNTSLPLSAWDPNHKTKVIDPDHTYNGWGLDYAGSHQDGFCHEYSNYSIYASTCPPYSYVQRSDVQPYFQIATNYGWANYMFQTNEGPSFPAHQFLFTGTSAPVAPKDSNNYYLDFVADNIHSADSGCPYNGANGWPIWAEPNGATENDQRKSECYPHDSLVTDAADCTLNHCDRGFSWTYYTPTPGIIWNAPAGIPEVCYTTTDNQNVACNGYEWTHHVRLPDKNGYSDAPIFDDLYNCSKPLAAINWVIPDFGWSDHPQDGAMTQPTVYGPSWVGDIIDAVGQACNGKYWTTEPTAILVVWDDWGGWFDHVPPIAALQQNPHTGYTQCDPNSQWGCGYTSGFRVPLLVVSPYTGTKNQDGSYSGYVSGPCVGNVCNNNRFPYQHDFGSILAFTEYNFTMPFIYQDTNYYADWNAPDWGQGRNNIPLSDFFPLSTPRPFVPISTPKDYTFFQNYYATTGTAPTGPDDDNAADQ
jgi:phospholipase C